MGELAGWPYWKVISITGQAGAGTDYQIKLEIGDSAGGDFHLEGHCTNFPQDIRITDDDGITLLDHWVEDLTADPIVVHVEVKDDLGSNRDVRVYYGKSGETTASNGANTFIQYHGADTVEFRDAAVVNPTNIVYEAKVRTLTSPSIIWGLSNTDNNTDDDMYIYSATGVYIAVSCHNDGAYTGKSESPELTINIWYKILFTFDGTTIYGYYDLNEISTGGLTTNLPNENLGLHQRFITGTGEQDWSFVRKYNSPEPAFSSAGAEQTPPIGAIMNQFQRANIGADLYNGVFA